MADTTVKFFHSAMPGAPTLSGTAGSLIAVLDACLVNGFGLGTLDSLVVAGGIATATRSAGHSFEKDVVALIAGATPAGLNGEKKILSVTATTFTFDATGIADQAATGTITAKLSPAGWAKPFSGANLAAYKSADVAATGCLLRVDDTGTTAARIVGYETMSDVNTGTGPFPTSAQQSGGLYWGKSSAANSSANNWFLIADGRMVYFAYAPRTAASGGTTASDYWLHCFGDFVALKAGDAYACLLTGGVTTAVVSSAVTTNQGALYYASNSAMFGVYVPRSYTGLGSSLNGQVTFPVPTNSLVAATSGAVGNSSSYMTYPNPTDGGLYLAPENVVEPSGLILRGSLPGFYSCPQSMPSLTFNTRDVVSAVNGLAGKTLRAISSLIGVVFIDTTGPWR